MNDLSTIYTYNNAGLHFFRVGNLFAALTLFKAAIEAKQAGTRFGDTIEQDSPEPADPTESSREVPRFQQADTFVEELETRGSEYGTTESTRISSLSDARSRDDITRHVLQLHSEDSPTFYIVPNPFELHETNERSADIDDDVLDLIISSKIIFNVALVHQLSSTADVSGHFYELSGILLQNLPDMTETYMLRVALLNNFAVWSYNNGDHDYARVSLEELQEVIEQGGGHIDSITEQSLRQNINSILNPDFDNSPAA